MSIKEKIKKRELSIKIDIQNEFDQYNIIKQLKECEPIGKFSFDVPDCLFDYIKKEGLHSLYIYSGYFSNDIVVSYMPKEYRGWSEEKLDTFFSAQEREEYDSYDFFEALYKDNINLKQDDINDYLDSLENNFENSIEIK